MAALRDLSFGEFVLFQFGHAIRPHGNPWYFDLDRDWWDPEPRTGVAYLIRLFGGGPKLLEPYSDAQIAQGLNGLVNTMAVGDQPWMRDAVTPAEDRASAWGAIACFFEDVLAPRCEASLGHCAAEMPPPINSITYMWWESFPGFTNPDDPRREQVDRAELQCLERILGLESIACQEAALHGLGHWVRREPRCEAIIDRYIAAGHAAHPDLSAYARAARSGCIQ